MKKILLIVFTILIFSSIGFAENKSLRISLNDEYTEELNGFLDLNNSKAMVSARKFSEKIGAEIEYLPPTIDRAGGFIIKTGETSIRMFEGSSKAYVMKDSKVQWVDIGSNVVNINWSNYIPLRFISEALGYSVEWYSTDEYDMVNIKTITDLNTK